MLVAVDPSHGLVITNWHVVRDAAGAILVSFPDGFTSGAVVLKTDHTWDLAALAIWRPNVQPTPIATEPARPGDILTIAGYGADSYRAVSGRCTEYLSPGGNNPAEIVELNVAARQGDSGGPIFNTRGEVAGVLFGANDSFLEGHYTMGSYCGRVRQFVASVGGDFQRLPVNSAMIARQPSPTQPAPPAAIAAAEPPPAWQTVPETRFSQTQAAGLPGNAAAPVPPSRGGCRSGSFASRGDFVHPQPCRADQDNPRRSRRLCLALSRRPADRGDGGIGRGFDIPKIQNLPGYHLTPTISRRVRGTILHPPPAPCPLADRGV